MCKVYSWCSDVCRSQKRVSDPMELVLQMAVSHHTGARSQTWVLEEQQQVILNMKPSLQTQKF